MSVSFNESDHARPHDVQVEGEMVRKRAAMLAYQKAYAAKNKDARAAYFTAYRAKNKESKSAYYKEYRAKKKDGWDKAAIAAYQKEYRANNKEALKEYNSMPHAKAAARDKSNRRRARKLGSDGKIDPAIRKWSKAWHILRKVRCYWCEGSFSPKACHEDHIVALKLGGQHKIANMCISCVPCNLRKWAHPIPTWNAMLSSPVLAL